MGAARVDTTPPTDKGADGTAFSTCPPGLDGARPFAFEEPYRDLDSSGEFNYPEPYCDANVNGRYDGVYLSGGADHLARRVHDPLDARAVAFSDGIQTVVMVSVVAQGLFENYTERMRAAAQAQRPGAPAWW